MPLTKLQFKPGVNREATTLSNEGGWYDCNNIRFRSGYPEKIGGWVTDTGAESTYQIALTPAADTNLPTLAPPSNSVTFVGSISGTILTVTSITSGTININQIITGTGVQPNTRIIGGSGFIWTVSVSQTVTSTTMTSTNVNPPSFWGVCRNLIAWLNLTGQNLLGLGTNLKYYIQNGIGGTFYDITPIRNGTAGNPSFKVLSKTGSAGVGSTVLTVTDASNGAQANDFVTFSGITATSDTYITSTILNAEFQVLAILDSNSYTISIPVCASTAALSSITLTGTSASWYQIITGSSIYTQALGWGAGGWGGFNGTGSTATTLSTAITTTTAISTITVASTTGFSTSYPGVIWIDDEGFTYTGVTSTTFTGVTRAYVGPTPTSTGAYTGVAQTHSVSAVVVQYPSATTGWGSAAPAAFGLGVQLRLWSSANYGQDLIITPGNAPMYYWANYSNTTIFNRAVLLGAGQTITTSTGTPFTIDASCPSLVNYVLVSSTSNFVIAFGCNDPSNNVTTFFDPLLIRWSDQQNVATWLPSTNNAAGSYRLSQGSAIVTAISAQQGILVFTDTAIYMMQYVGQPYVWGFQNMASDTSIIGPNAVANINNAIYWMGYNKFYFFNGTVQTLPCAVRQYVFDNINLSQSNQVYAGTNEAYNEIWWFYPSATGRNADGSLGNSTQNTINDSYVVYNYLDQTWYYGALQRTSWLYSPLRQTPVSTDYYGHLIYQENGVDDGTTNPASPVNSYVQSSDFDIGDGNNFGFIWRLVPDINFTGSYQPSPTVALTVLPRQNPGNNYGLSNNQPIVSQQNYSPQREFIIQTFTPQVYVRARGRQMALKISSPAPNNTGLGVQWQSGVHRLEIRPDGKR